jgi:hypothetical protein
VRRRRAGRGRSLRSSSLAAGFAAGDCQDDAAGELGVGSVLGEGDEDDEDGDVDGDDDEEDLDGFGDDEENLAVGDGDPECFREPGADVPGCGAAPPADLPGASEPGRFGPDRLE